MDHEEKRLIVKARLDKIIKIIKANRFLLSITVLILVILAQLIISTFGMFFSVIVTAFIVSMYYARDKTHYVTFLKILGVIVLVGGTLLTIILVNHEWPGN